MSATDSSSVAVDKMSASLSYLALEAASSGSTNRGGTWPDAHGKTKDSRSRQMGTEIGPKVECVYSLLSMLGSHDIKVTASKFLDLSKSPETCSTLRRSGCIPLLVQMIHSDSDDQSRKYAAQALHNVVHCHPDDKAGRRESKVLKLIEAIIDYGEYLKSVSIAVSVTASSSTTSMERRVADDRDRHPSQAIFSLMKISFDEEHRHAMCQLGALQAIACLVHMDHAMHGVKPTDSRCVSLRRYAGMALTNLTFGDGNNKALLCSNKEFMRALVAQLNSAADDLIQVTASVLRNLSWRADNNMIAVLNEIGTVTALTSAAMRNNTMENTLKAILSALWNLSAHCSSNKAEFCRVDGALAFLVEMLTFEAPSKTLTIIENAGGILRNVSSHIAVREDYRHILRERDCLGILLQQLRSESLTIVSNACGTLWNLSARCPTDQKYLWDNGAVPMLRSLIHSKHKMISNGSNAALKNLLNYRPGNLSSVHVDSVTRSMNLKELPTLRIRKQRALEQELEKKLSDTCEIIDMQTESPHKEKCKLPPSKEVTQQLGEYHERLETREDQQQEGDNAIDETTVAIEKDPTERQDQAEVENSDEVSTAEEQQRQEPELDQITNYSLRYAENQLEVEEEKITGSGGDQFNGTEIILILEDTVKCYQEEGTPYAISSATSMTDLRTAAKEQAEKRPAFISNIVRLGQRSTMKQQPKRSVPNSGLQTPEKPVNYCDEGTPECFSREISHTGSLSSLDGIQSPQVEPILPAKIDATPSKVEGENTKPAIVEEKPIITTVDGKAKLNPAQAKAKVVSFTDTNAAQLLETPLMFSRTSSMESLSSAAAETAGTMPDDGSSVVSEFSRVASGLMSPSELPDSPTQSMPQSPTRKRLQGPVHEMQLSDAANSQLNDGKGQHPTSVFADKVDKFAVENTPAQFSCATSLSNLSILNEEGPSRDDNVAAELYQGKSKTPDLSDSDDECAGADAILDECINRGINKGLNNIKSVAPTASLTSTAEAVQLYFTEDTPALLSKACSNSDLSVLSMLDNSNQCEIVQFSDESSSDVSDGGVGNEDLLEQCIQNGIEKSIAKAKHRQEEEQKERAIADKRVGRSDSLSSLSVDSEEENNSLEEAIAAGINRKVANKVVFAIGAPVNPERQRQRAPADLLDNNNESFSSMESCESNDRANLLLEQCIQSGINRRPTTTTKSTKVQKSTGMENKVRSQRTSVKSQKRNDDENERILLECINRGIEKNVRKSSLSAIPKHQPSGSSEQVLAKQNQDILRRLERMTLEEKYGRPDDDREQHRGVLGSSSKKLMNPKNANGASVAGSESEAIASVSLPVERKLMMGVVLGDVAALARPHERVAEINSNSTHNNNSNIYSRQEQLRRPRQSDIEGTGAPSDGHPIQRDAINNKGMHMQTSIPSSTIKISHNSRNSHEKGTAIINSINGFDPSLEQSNEYPALKLSHQDDGEEEAVSPDSKLVMVASNEYMSDKNSVNRSVCSGSFYGSGHEFVSSNKHKDPDLMLKSVDRLTQALVSTAEYLRAHPTTEEMVSSGGGDKKSSSTNDTWNENTCPNGDVSFPSFSYSAPKLDEGPPSSDDDVNDDDDDDDTLNASLSLNKNTEPGISSTGTATAAAHVNINGVIDQVDHHCEQVGYFVAACTGQIESRR